MFNIFQYGFVVRGLEAGLIVGLIAPLIGVFLVLRRYSQISDSLAHISLAGIAIGLISGINTIITTIITTIASSVFIEKLRISKRVFGESALSLFLSGSLAVAILIIGISRGFNVSLFNYLFGSIVTVKQTDVYVIGALGLIIIGLIAGLYEQLVYVSFDEESAQVSGIPTRFLNLLLIMLTALTVSIAIPIVGILLISALIVIPVVSALQYKRSFKQTIMISEIFSLLSVFIGIFTSFHMNLPTGATIVLITLIFFVISLLINKK